MLVNLLGRVPELGEPLGETGILYHPSMDIHDPSKIQMFMDSPRKYFYSSMLGLGSESENIHLAFGSAWHSAQEHMALSLNTDDPYSNRVIMEAYELFMDTFRMKYPNENMWYEDPAKNPANALKALAEYASVWKGDIGRYNTLYTEVAGSIPIREDRVLHWKMDTILLEEGEYILSLEHKTTGVKKQSWLNQWGVIIQPWAYTYALKGIFQEEAVKGVLINGSILRKKENEHIRIPVAKSDAMLREGLWRTNHYLDQIEWNLQNLLETSPNDDVMPAFPCNGVSCSKSFNGCEYSDLCNIHANPLQHTDRLPVGMVIDYWDPRRKQEEAKHVVNLSEGARILTKEEVDALKK